MAYSIFNFMYFIVLCLGIFIQISQCMRITCEPKNHAALFIFGDSLFDIGNNNYINTTTPSYQANYPPYGETFFKYPSGRFSDGRMIPDYVAELANLPIPQPYLHPEAEYTYGTNFASGGAGALSETFQGFVIDLKTQVSYLKNVKNIFKKKLGHAKTEELLSNSVYLFSIGGNDYGAIIETNSSGFIQGFLPVDRNKYADAVIGNITNALKEIYKLGGRKYGFVNVGPVGCSPAIRWTWNNGSTGPCFEEFSTIARLHNNKLEKMLQELEKELKGFKYSITDFYSAVSALMQNPSKYGFKEASAGCCGGGAYRGDNSCGGMKGIKEYELCDNVNEYIFFDSLHPTDAASRHYGHLIWNGNITVTRPYNLKQLFEFQV